MELVAASGLGLKIGDRLEAAIVDRSGQVLLQKGKVVGSEAVLERLNERGFFQRQTIEEEDLSALDRLEEQLHRESSTEGRLALLVEQIEKLLRCLVRPPSGTTWADLESVVRWLDDLFVRDQDQFIGAQQLLAGHDRLLVGQQVRHVLDPHGASVLRVPPGPAWSVVGCGRPGQGDR